MNVNEIYLMIVHQARDLMGSALRPDRVYRRRYTEAFLVSVVYLMKLAFDAGGTQQIKFGRSTIVFAPTFAVPIVNQEHFHRAPPPLSTNIFLLCCDRTGRADISVRAE